MFWRNSLRNCVALPGLFRTAPLVSPPWYEQFTRTHLSTEAECTGQGVQFLPVVAETSVDGAPAAWESFNSSPRSRLWNGERKLGRSWISFLKCSVLLFVALMPGQSSAGSEVTRQAVLKHCSEQRKWWPPWIQRELSTSNTGYRSGILHLGRWIVYSATFSGNFGGVF